MSLCILYTLMLYSSVSYTCFEHLFYKTYTDGRNWSPVAENDTNSIFKILWLNPLLVVGSSIVFIFSSGSIRDWFVSSAKAKDCCWFMFRSDKLKIEPDSEPIWSVLHHVMISRLVYISVALQNHTEVWYFFKKPMSAYVSKLCDRWRWCSDLFKMCLLYMKAQCPNSRIQNRLKSPSGFHTTLIYVCLCPIEECGNFACGNHTFVENSPFLFVTCKWNIIWA